ncbi:MAG: TIGR03085 family metal-binding protein [Actinomycetota bacterium]|nr:TIGR03085 family metal-binding protein [Actinomycetota bacterium]
MTNWAQVERGRLCDLLTTTGPDAPTLCGDWTTRDLAAHLVIRERRPDAAAGILVPFLRSWNQRVQDGVAQGSDWDQLVRTLRSGPPAWSPMRFGAVDSLANTVEFLVHHEDVRRAAEGWEPRTLDPGLESAALAALGQAKLLVRSSPVGIVLEPTDGSTIVAKDHDPRVVVRGPASELLLFVYGRQAHAAVTVEGDEADVIAAREASFGL